MKSADEMIKYCRDNNTGYDFKWIMKRNFGIIEKQLMSNEIVHVCFVGLHNYENPSKHDGNWAYALTDTRIIMSQKKINRRASLCSESKKSQ